MANESSLGGAQFVFDLDTQAGAMRLLAAVRASDIAPEEKNELRDLVFSYANGDHDESVRIIIEQKVIAHGIQPLAAPEAEVEEEPAASTLGSARIAPDFSVSKSTPQTPTSQSIQSAPEPVSEPATAPEPPEPPKPVPAPEPPKPQSAPAPIPEPPKSAPATVTPTPTPDSPKPAPAPEPVQPAPVAPTPTPESPKPKPAAPAPAANTDYDPDQSLRRIREIKSIVNDKVGNPVNLVDIDNGIGREYMGALLDAMKKLNSGTSAVSAMQRLEDAFSAVEKTIEEHGPEIAAKKMPAPTPTPKPAPEPANPAESAPAPMPEPPKPAPAPEPVQPAPVAPTLAPEPPKPEPKPMPEPPAPKPTPEPLKPKSEPVPEPVKPEPAPEPPRPEPVEQKEEPHTVTPVPPAPEPPKPKPAPEPVKPEPVPEPPKPEPVPEPPKPKPARMPEPPKPEPAPVVSISKPEPKEEDSPTNLPGVVAMPHGKAAPTRSQMPVMDIEPAWGPATDTVLPQKVEEIEGQKVSSLAQTENKLRTPDELIDPASLESSSVDGDLLFTKEVDDGLQQLLQEWPLFKKSGLFGTGPKGREHPLFKKIAELQIPLLLAGRLEGATQEIKQSITDYMNGWRYEQGIIYQQGETFEHYLRRVIRHILDLQKGKEKS